MSTNFTDLPPKSVQQIYVPLVVETSTCTAKTVLMTTILCNAFCVLLFFVTMVNASASHDYSAGSTITGCVMFLVWNGAWLWAAILGYRSVLALRKECLDAKLKSYQG
jgi:hypothetical protein